MNSFPFGKKPDDSVCCPFFCKIMLIMKITLLLMLSLIVGVQAKGLAQNVNLSLKDATLEQAFEEIGRQTHYRFLYNDELIRNTKPVTIQIKNAGIAEVLQLLTEEQNLRFKLIAGTVSITSAERINSLTATAPPQDIVITGTVKDTSGVSLPGASVTVKNASGRGVTTDGEGRFKLTVPQNATLVISFIGFRPLEIKVTSSNTINAVLRENESQLNEVVVVGYGTQKRSSLTAAISTVSGSDLDIGPVGNVSNTLGGNVSGIITRQTSGEPGLDNASVLLRGNAPLVLVDGVERPWDKVNLADIASVSILKDASAVAPYGLKGANGVMLITTKRGSEGKVSFTYNGEYGWQKPMNTPKFMDAYSSMALRNTALIMDGKPDQVVSEDIMDLYKTGTDQYPNTDWVGNYLNSSNSQQHNLSASGGNERTRAFVSLGYLDQGNMMGDTYGYKRYSIRSNVDIKPTPLTTFSVDLSLINDQRRFQGISSADLMLDLYRLPATEPDVYSNGLPAFSPTLGGSVYAQLHSGSNIQRNEFQNISLTMNQELPFLKGLSVKANFAYDKQLYKWKQWSEPYISYQLNNESEYVEHNGWETSKPTLEEGDRFWTNYTFQGYLNYQNQFGKHSIQALAVYERRWGDKSELSAGRTQYDFDIPELNMGSSNKEYQSNGGYSSEYAQQGVVARINYNYNQKYLLEVAGRYDASYRYAPGRRTALFPSASVGWRVSEEGFLKGRFKFLDDLKLRASYGKSGNPVGQEFAYLSKYLVTNSYVFGNGTATPVQYQGVYEGQEPNTALTWETVWKANLGLDLNMWKGLLGLEFDIYRDKRNDKILAPNAVVPAEYGIGLSDENAGKESRWGIDLTLTNRTKITGNLSMRNNLVFGFTRNKQIEIREAAGTKNIPRKRRTGRPGNLTWGYKTAGLFKDEEDIADWAYQNSSVLPGDIKYVDINGDGKIDAEDQVVIGRNATPEIMWGYNLSLNYKGFDLGAMIQGTGNSDYYLGSADRGVRYPFENGKPLVSQAGSWTVDNPDPNARFPRLSATKRTPNYEVSDYWMVNSSYIKLKSIELGYRIKPGLTKKLFINDARVYLNFYNVWNIFSKMPDDFDSENLTYNSYPQQFISTLGVNITF